MLGLDLPGCWKKRFCERLLCKYSLPKLPFFTKCFWSWHQPFVTPPKGWWWIFCEWSKVFKSVSHCLKPKNLVLVLNILMSGQCWKEMLKFKETTKSTRQWFDLQTQTWQPKCALLFFPDFLLSGSFLLEHVFDFFWWWWSDDGEYRRSPPPC